MHQQKKVREKQNKKKSCTPSLGYVSCTLHINKILPIYSVDILLLIAHIEINSYLCSWSMLYLKLWKQHLDNILCSCSTCDSQVCWGAVRRNECCLGLVRLMKWKKNTRDSISWMLQQLERWNTLKSCTKMLVTLEGNNFLVNEGVTLNAYILMVLWSGN